MFTRRGFTLSVAVSAVAAAAITVVPDFMKEAQLRAQEMEAAREQARNARKTLLDAAHFDGARTLFMANGIETNDVNAFDLAVWCDQKTEQMTVLPAKGAWAGMAATFMPKTGILRITRMAKEEKIDTFTEAFAWPELLARPTESVIVLRDHPSQGDKYTYPKDKPLFSKSDSKRRLFRVSGEILKAQPFEMAFGNQHKLAINLDRGSYVFNTFGQRTAFYGRIPQLTVEASAILHP